MLLLRQHRTSLLCDGVGLLHVFFFFLNSFHLLKKKTTTFTPFLFCPSPSFFFSLTQYVSFFLFISVWELSPSKKRSALTPSPCQGVCYSNHHGFNSGSCSFFFFSILFFFSTPFSFIPCRLITAAIVESSIHTHTDTHRTVRGQPLCA